MEQGFFPNSPVKLNSLGRGQGNAVVPTSPVDGLPNGSGNTSGSFFSIGGGKLYVTDVQMGASLAALVVNSLAVKHTFKDAPVYVVGILRCIAADLGYPVGAVFPFYCMAEVRPIAYWSKTQLKVLSSSTATFLMANAGTGVHAAPVSASWVPYWRCLLLGDNV